MHHSLLCLREPHIQMEVFQNMIYSLVEKKYWSQFPTFETSNWESCETFVCSGVLLHWRKFMCFCCVKHLTLILWVWGQIYSPAKNLPSESENLYFQTLFHPNPKVVFFFLLPLYLSADLFMWPTGENAIPSLLYFHITYDEVEECNFHIICVHIK